jgi:uncharacterized protein YodC (DUF2158 family)
MAEFKIGDTVRLKSGGPLMTIAGVGDSPQVINHSDYWLCTWFDKTHKSHSSSYHKDSLEAGTDAPLMPLVL